MQCTCILKGKDAIKLQVLKFLENTMENRHLTTDNRQDTFPARMGNSISQNKSAV